MALHLSQKKMIMKNGCLVIFLSFVLLYLLTFLNKKFEVVTPKISYFSNNDACGVEYEFQIFFQYKTGMSLECGGCFPIGAILFPVTPNSMKTIPVLQKEYETLKENGLGFTYPVADSLNPFWKNNDCEIFIKDDNWKGFPRIGIEGGLDTNGIFREKEVRIYSGSNISLEEQKPIIEKYSEIIENLPKMKPATINGEKIPLKWNLWFFVRDSLYF